VEGCRTCTVVSIDDPQRFEADFRRFAGHVHSYVLRRADPELAQDVTAETFLIAWRRRQQAPEQPLPWLYGIARRVLANERRAANRRDALAGRLAAETPPRTVGSDAQEVLAAVARLSEKDCEALLLTAWEGLSSREAAEVLGCSPGTFAVRLHRARRRLARILAQARGEQTNPACPEHSVSEVSA
jgi:RNA polymerase sigma-70 factor, ECF subfamily